MKSVLLLISFFLVFPFMIGAQGQIEKENKEWEKIKSSNNYELFVKFCDDFYKGTHFKEAWELKEKLGVKMIQTRYKEIFDFFNEKNTFDYYPN